MKGDYKSSNDHTINMDNHSKINKEATPGMYIKRRHNSPDSALRKSSSSTGSLYIFPNQVAGHMPIISSKRGMVSKPAQAQEIEFYEAMYNESTIDIKTETLSGPELNSMFKNIGSLKPLQSFIPSYFGCCYVDIDSILQDGIRSRDGKMEFKGAAKSSPRISRSISDSNNRKKSGREKSRMFSKNLWKKFKDERRKSKRLEFDDDGKCKYIVLEDLTSGHEEPCILDIKMGTRQHGVNDNPAKVERKIKRCKETTSFQTGMRICGMQVYHRSKKESKPTQSSKMMSEATLEKDVDESSLLSVVLSDSAVDSLIDHDSSSSSSGDEMIISEVASPLKARSTLETSGSSRKRSRSWNEAVPYIIRKEKMWGRELKVHDLTNAMKEFLYDGNRLRSEIINSFVSKLEKLKNIINAAKGWRFWSSSILLIYDSKAADILPFKTSSHAETSTPANNVEYSFVDIRIIDFAHTVFIEDDTNPDVGFLLGITNLISLLNGLVSTTSPTTTTVSPSDNKWDIGEVMSSTTTTTTKEEEDEVDNIFKYSELILIDSDGGNECLLKKHLGIVPADASLVGSENDDHEGLFPKNAKENE